ncbi:MAG TPA: DUF1015 domain-containing protein [Flavobacterium sp.]|jgi:uncharacterized protein (DUF1015 family)
MAKIVPFRAVRPTRDKVSLVTSRSYEEYSPAELAAQLEFNPLSFLHVLNPAYTNLQNIDPSHRFRLVKQKYQEFRNDNILVKDEKPSIYLHRIVMGKQIFTGIIAGTSIDDYKRQVIKTHENTISYRVEFFKNYMKHADFNTEPVLMAYPDNPIIGKWVTKTAQTPADFEFSTTRREVHYLWKVDDEKDIKLLQETFATMPNFYIADGHHRSASAELLFAEEGGNGKKDFFMSFLISDSNVRIFSFNRLVKDLNGLSNEEFLRRLSTAFLIKPTSNQVFIPAERHEFGMYIGDQFYSLTLKEENRRFSSVLESLDAQILYDTVLLPILGIKDLRNDERICYLSGKLHISHFISRIDEGDFKVGFVLCPSNISEIKAIADAGLIMPPKSTYIEPKFRSGLVVHELSDE